VTGTWVDALVFTIVVIGVFVFGIWLVGR